MCNVHRNRHVIIKTQLSYFIHILTCRRSMIECVSFWYMVFFRYYTKNWIYRIDSKANPSVCPCSKNVASSSNALLLRTIFIHKFAFAICDMRRHSIDKIRIYSGTVSTQSSDSVVCIQKLLFTSASPSFDIKLFVLLVFVAADD